MAKAAKAREERLGPIGKVVRFIRETIRKVVLFVRQVVAELKKVNRPTRQELWTYSSVVVVFVLIVMAFIFGVDTLVSKAVMAVFG